MENTNRNSDEIFAVTQSATEGNWDRVRDLIVQSRRGGAGLGQDLGISYSRGAFLPDNSEAPVVEDPINDYNPSARPGWRAPHLWIQKSGIRLSTLDLFDGTFVLLMGKNNRSKPPRTHGVTVLQNGKDFVANGFEELYGITATGAVLVRPDGYVGARLPQLDEDFSDRFQSAFGQILRVQ
jgi:putative polyketide hydroxylase